MKSLTLTEDISEVLLLGAHCDDIEIGCGATVLQYLRSRPDLKLTWVVFSSNAERRAEATKAAHEFAAGTTLNLDIQNFRNGYFPSVASDIKDYFEDLKSRVAPDLIFTHCRHDLHQDHRTISELTWNTFRDHLILEYEIAKFDADLGTPNVFVPVSHTTMETKLALLDASFVSQHGHQWFRRGVFEGLLNIRGVECNAPEGLAEAFYARKLNVVV